MRRVSRHDVVQAMGVLGVRLSGVVERAHFEDARTQALAGVRALLIESHPDRHAASGHAQRATARAQEVSAAEHLLRSTAWFEVAHLFAVKRRSSGAAAHRDLDDEVTQQVWDIWSHTQASTGSTGPARRRYYKRCSRCGRLTLESVEHYCGTRVDPTATRRRPMCNDESPLGVNCEEPPGHGGWHRGYGPKGRHSWSPHGSYAQEAVEMGDHDP